MDGQSYINGMLDRTALFYDSATIQKIRDTVFSISGFGGVGAITAELLARWGIKKFRLLDMDCYDESNLNRQIYATAKTLRRYKAEVTAERILEINPYAEIEMLIKEPVNNENIEKFTNGAGMIIQTADSPLVSYFTVRQNDMVFRLQTDTVLLLGAGSSFMIIENPINGLLLKHYETKKI